MESKKNDPKRELEKAIFESITDVGYSHDLATELLKKIGQIEFPEFLIEIFKNKKIPVSKKLSLLTSIYKFIEIVPREENLEDLEISKKLSPYLSEILIHSETENQQKMGLYNVSDFIAEREKESHPVTSSPISSGGGGGGGCFIATASFGTPFEKEVLILCQFRDSYLLSNFWGRIIVKIYNTISPPIAKCIEIRPFLKYIIRWFLKSIVWFTKHFLRRFPRDST